jgi:aminoglycoside phosphotransferase family enzyme
MDVAEELSFLAIECEILGSPATGQVFLNAYKKSFGKIPDVLISFYKAKRAFLRAKLTIYHLLEERYRSDEQKWKSRCLDYLLSANAYCKQLSKDNENR